MDNERDTAEPEAWMTYSELAAARSIKRVAAVRLVQRHGWRRQAGNDGRMRALVPPEWAKPGDRASAHDVGDDVAGDVADDRAAFIAAYVETFRTALSAKDAEIGALREVIEAKSGEIATFRASLEARDAEVRSLRVLFEEGRELIEQVRAQAQEAVRAADALRQADDDARKAGGRLARAWRAWRGE